MSERPDYITCIARTHNNHVGHSWCDQYVKSGFHFMDIDHLAENNLAGGRLIGCPECIKKIIEAITSNSQLNA